MISLFREIMGQAKTSLTPALNYREIKAAIDERIKGRQNFESEEPWMDVDVFIKRYKNARFSAISAGVLGCISLLSVAFAPSLQGFFLALLSFIVLGLFYVKLNFLLWASRETVFGQAEKVVRITDYLSACASDPLQLLPLSLAHEARKK